MKTPEQYENEIAELNIKLKGCRETNRIMSPILGELIRKAGITGTVFIDDALGEKLLNVLKGLK